MADILACCIFYLIIGIIVATVRDWEGDVENPSRKMPPATMREKIQLILFWPWYWAKSIVIDLRDLL